MGCDIHFFVEKRQPGGRWELVDEIENRQEEYGTAEPCWGAKDYQGFYHDRNYFLFGILAQVRRDVEPNFGPPRGRPDDASEGYTLVADSDSADGHSHSWLTLPELLAFPWLTKIAVTRLTSFENYAHWVRSGDQAERVAPPGDHKWFPKDTISAKEMDDLVATYNGLLEGGEQLHEATAEVFLAEHKDKHADAEYDSTFIERSSDFQMTLMRLLDLARDVGLENVRVVFYFDN